MRQLLGEVCVSTMFSAVFSVSVHVAIILCVLNLCKIELAVLMAILHLVSSSSAL